MIVYFTMPTMITSLFTVLGARSVIAHSTRPTTVADAPRSFSLDSSPHELDCQPNDDDCDR